MIKCPKCGATLPQWAQACQFCGTGVANVPRPKPDPRAQRAAAVVGSPKWVPVVYYLIATYWLISGVFDLLAGMGVFTKNPQYGTAIFGGISAILGLGLLLKVELIRGIVNIYSWVKIVGGLFNLAASLLLQLVLGPLGVILMLISILDIVTAGLMIYLISETDV